MLRCFTFSLRVIFINFSGFLTPKRFGLRRKDDLIGLSIRLMHLSHSAKDLIAQKRIRINFIDFHGPK